MPSWAMWGWPSTGTGRRGRDIGLILHLSASTSIGPDPNDKVLVNSVTNAMKMGADAVSMHVNVGSGIGGEDARRPGKGCG